MPSAERAERERWMAIAHELAAARRGFTSPNPPVGCVITKRGKLVATGAHQRAGRPHAEIEALRRAGSRARGADMYVTLEPCCHEGRTGPCTKALIDAGIARVFVGCLDPNPLVAGKGTRELRRAGVPTEAGILEKQCSELIRGFRRWVQDREPWTSLKLAASLDGRIAAKGGAAKWLSSPQSRRVVQDMRARCDAILVGVETVLTDDPRLTCRRPGAKQPLRVILDRRLRTPPTARAVTGPGGVLILCSKIAPPARRRRLERAGAEVLAIDPSGRAGWKRLLRELARRNVLELLIEGGSRVATSALSAGVVNEVTIFYTPKLIGSDGIPLVGRLGVRDPSRAPRLKPLGSRSSGPDLIWTGVPVPRSRPRPI